MVTASCLFAACICQCAALFILIVKPKCPVLANCELGGAAAVAAVAAILHFLAAMVAVVLPSSRNFRNENESCQ